MPTKIVNRPKGQPGPTRGLALLRTQIPDVVLFRMDQKTAIPTRVDGGRDRSRCWLWTGAITRNPAGKILCGMISIPGFGIVLVHRAAYVLHVGDIPEVGLVVGHTCHNRLCVNPDHLSLGSHADAVDAWRASLPPPPAKPPPVRRFKLSPEQVAEARALHADGMSIWAIAKRYPVAYSTVWMYVTGDHAGDPLVAT